MMLASLFTTAIVAVTTVTMATRITGLPKRISAQRASVGRRRCGTTTVASPSTAFPASAVRARL